MLGVPLTRDGSDSQDLSRTVEALIYRQGLTLVEAMELVLPPIVDEIKGMPGAPARLLHVPAPGVRPVRAGPGGAGLALRRRARVLRRRARPAAAVADRDRRRIRVLLRAGRGGGGRHGVRAQAARPGREGAGGGGPRARGAGSTATTPRCRRSACSAGASAPVGAGRRRLRRGDPHRRPARTGSEIPGYTERRAVRAGEGGGPRAGRLRLAARGHEARAADGAPPAPSRSARSATTARWPASRPSARTWPTTSRSRSPWSPTRRSTASARWSTSPAAPCSARGPRCTTSGPEPAHGGAGVPGGARRPRRPGAALGRGLPRRSPTSTRPTCSRTCGRPSAGARGARHLVPRVRGHARRDRAAQAGGHHGGARGRGAAGALRPHRLRGRPPLPRPPPGAGRRGPGAARALRLARRDQPAPALRRGAALGRDPQRARHRAGARPRRRRRVPVRDGRGVAARRLPHRRRQPGRRAAQGHREGDLDDRHPRGARLRAAVLLDRAAARAGGGVRHARLHGLARPAAPASPSWTPTATSASACWPARRSPSPRRRSASTPRSTRRRSPRPTAPATSREYSQKVRELEAEQPISLRHILDVRSDREPIPAEQVRSRRGPALLPDRDLLDELRVAGRDRLPRLRRGGQAGQHHRDERRGRRDPGHVRQVPALARPAGGLRPLRRHQRDDQLVLPGGDQDRPGREARRGRPPARQEGHRQGGPGAQRHQGHGPDLALEQPRPLLDRGPGRADRRAARPPTRTCACR